MNNSSKIFDEFPTVDCNECANYWDNSCDSPKTLIKGSVTPCNSFLATRSVVIPLKLERLEKAFKWLVACVVILGVVSIGTTIAMLFLIFGG